MSPAKTVKKKNVKLNITPSEELEVLRKVVEITHSELNLGVVLDEVVKIVTDMTKADSVFIYLFDDKRKNLMLMASKTPHKKELGHVLLKVGEGITGWVAKENKPVAITQNAYKDKRFKNFDVLPEDKYEAFLSAPIIFRDKVIGVVNVQHRKSHEYASNTKKLISLIAKQIGGALTHARMYEDMKNKALQFDSLNKVSQSITSENYLDEILDLIVVVTAKMLNSKLCSILLLDKKGNELFMKATQSMNPEYTKKPNIKVEGSIAGEAITTKKPAMVLDVRSDARYRFPELAEKENLVSMLVVPMTLKDTAIGVISIYTHEEHHFTDEEVNVLQIVANQAAVAIENTKLVDEALKAKEALETRKLVERAKGILMKMRGLDEEAAHKIIHKKSMDSCKSMREVAESIILLDELQK